MDYHRGKRFLDTLPDWERGRPTTGPLDHYLPRVRRLLHRLGNPQAGIRSVIVGGTNGKGTVATLVAELLQASGLRCGLFTSPHLHSQRERIRVDGQMLSKDDWAEGLTRLYDGTRGFAAESLGEISWFEAVTVLAADLFARQQVDIAIYEVGLGGRYDSTNAWDHELATLTHIGLDHCEILGHGLTQIAAEKLPIARPGRPLFTQASQEPAVLAHIHRHCAEAGIRLYLVDVDGVRTPDETVGFITPVRSDGPRPCTFIENARLALAVAQKLEPALEAARAARVLEEFQQAGRFEIVGRDPWVIVDGAHNPAAARCLAVDLQPLAEGWCFILGMNSGHDAAGVLAALAPLAGRIILTHSEHPKAQDPHVIAAAAPAGVDVQVIPDLRQALQEAGRQDPVCITGSLHLVARAREQLHQPYEAEGISEDVALESLVCLRAACERQGLSLQPVTGDGNVVRLVGGRRPLLFYRNKHPFNDYVAAKMAEDKGYQQEIFEAADLPVPQSLQVFNPYADDRFNRYKTHDDIPAMLKDVEENLDFPVVIKKPRSSVSQGVYPEAGSAAVARRLQSLFENAGFLDNVLLIQAFVPGPEYRILATGGQLLLAYGKVSDGDSTVGGDLNPLHHASGRAVRVEDTSLLARMADLTCRIAAAIDLGFYAIDVIDGPDGLCILELNPNPFCYFYNRSNGREDFIRLYEGLIDRFVR